MDLNVIFIYIFAWKLTKHTEWPQKYYKVQGVYTHFDDLIASIENQTFFKTDNSIVFKKSNEEFAFSKASEYFKDWSLDEQMTQ